VEQGDLWNNNLSLIKRKNIMKTGDKIMDHPEDHPLKKKTKRKRKSVLASFGFLLN